MDLIHRNPFRILGLQITASERDITKRVSDLEAYMEIGKEVTYDTDFPVLSRLERTSDTVREAANAIETEESRFYHSLFWFWNKNSADDLALDVLKDGNVDKAIQLLECRSAEKTTSKMHVSNAKNSAIIMLAIACENGSYNFEKLSTALKWAGKVFTAENLIKYQEHITDTTFTIDHQKIISSFIDEIIKTVAPYIDKPGGITIPQFISQFASFPEEARRHASAKFTSKHILNIEDAIQASEKARKKYPEKADEPGEKLCKDTINDLVKLKDILTEQDFQYQSIADKLAEEITDCSIAYYNSHINNDTGVDPGEKALMLARSAASIAVGIKVKRRLEKGIPVIEEWVNNKSQREKSKKIQIYIDAIVHELGKLPDLSGLNFSSAINLPNVAKNLINACRHSLVAINTVDHQLYLEWSSTVAGIALNLCIEYANHTHDMTKALTVMELVGQMDMDLPLVQRYNANIQILDANLLSSTPSSSGGGCYVATMIYGSYEAPEVQVLRRFRDSVLSKYLMGRAFIRFYYKLSPFVVRKVSQVRCVNTYIRYFLDHLVRRLA